MYLVHFFKNERKEFSDQATISTRMEMVSGKLLFIKNIKKNKAKIKGLLISICHAYIPFL